MNDSLITPPYVYYDRHHHNMREIIDFVYDKDIKAIVRYKIKTNHLEITDSKKRTTLKLYPGESLRFESNPESCIFSVVNKTRKEEDYV